MNTTRNRAAARNRYGVARRTGERVLTAVEAATARDALAREAAWMGAADRLITVLALLALAGAALWVGVRIR